jgi:acetate CoA/acetoacetate CoA-transferase beta subunit
MPELSREEKRKLIQKRIAKELKDGDYVNLGIGMPTGVANFISDDIYVTIHSENGILGLGAAPEEGKEIPNLINAGGGFVTEAKGASYFDSCLSFAIIRGGHLDATVLGALQVDQDGNLANWMIPGKMVPGMGGAMDLVTGAKKVIIAMEHLDKKGNPKILKKCNLPLTAVNKVDMVVTDMAVIIRGENGLVLKEVAEGYTKDDVIKATEAELTIADEVKTFSVKD